MSAASEANRAETVSEGNLPKAFAPSLLTHGHLLGGQVRYAQPRSGFRSGIEPVLLAAAIPARAGERVLEGGTGAGAGLLCLAARLPGLRGIGVERVPALARLAQANARANGMEGLAFVAADLARLPFAAQFDHAFANPPYHRAGATPSPDPLRATAKQLATPESLDVWTAALAARLRHGGTLTLILPSGLLAEAMAGLTAAKLGSIGIFPLWPDAQAPAKLTLLRGIKGGRGPSRLLAGLRLHTDTGGFTDEAESVLRGGAPLGF